MTAHDLRQIGIWAAVTAIVVAGIFGGHTAYSVGPDQRGPEVTVNGCRISATAAAAAQPYKVLLTVKAENPTPQKQHLNLDLSLIRRQFTGDPTSRVPRPNDYKTTQESTRKLTFDVPAGGKAEKKVEMVIQARRQTPPPPPASEDVRVLNEGALSSPPSYLVRVGPDEQDTIAYFSATITWPKSSTIAK